MASMAGQSFLLGPISLFSQWVTDGKMIHGLETEQVIMALLGDHSQPSLIHSCLLAVVLNSTLVICQSVLFLDMHAELTTSTAPYRSKLCQ